MTRAQLMRTVSTRSGLTRAVVPLGTLEVQEIVKVIFVLLFVTNGPSLCFFFLDCFLSIPISPRGGNIIRDVSMNF